MNKCIKITTFIFLFVFFFISTVIVMIPLIISINSVGSAAITISLIANNNRPVIVEFINETVPKFIARWNAFTVAFNTISTIIPTIFTVLNQLCRIIKSIIDTIVEEYCPTGLLDCLSGAISTAIVDVLNILIEIFKVLSGMFDTIRSVLDSIICDPILSGAIGYIIPTECSAGPLPIIEVVKWGSKVIEFILLNNGLTIFIRNAFCDWGGECGLKATNANTLPHEFPTDVDDVNNIFEAVSRMYFRPAILKNAAFGITWNVAIAPADFTFCALLPLNFVPCVFGDVCNFILVPFNLVVFPEVKIGIVTVGPFSVTIDLGNLFCLPTGGCPCTNCVNPLGIPGPCIISGDSDVLSCAPCGRFNTNLDLVWDTIITQIDPSLGSSPVSNTAFNNPPRAGQNQLVV